MPPIRSEPGLSCFGFAHAHTLWCRKSLTLGSSNTTYRWHASRTGQTPRTQGKRAARGPRSWLLQTLLRLGLWDATWSQQCVASTAAVCCARVARCKHAATKQNNAGSQQHLENRRGTRVAYATQHALFNGRVRFPIDCKFCHRPRTNKRKKGKFALRSWR